MAYTKTTWQNNVTDIDANNLNKIEQGIYDNSLIADAVTNKLNPRDTETYKTAELTEGQITDVIGVKDILIKGQTSQNGEPTPSSPVNVNVVSGSNVIKLSSKNLLDGATWTKNQALNESNTAYTANGWEYSNYIDISQANYYYPGATGESPRTILYDKNKNVIAVLKVSSNTVYNLSSYKAKYIRVSTTTAKKESTKVYQGKELPLDLPVENLLDISKLSLISNNNYLSSGTNKISIKPNTTYTFKVKESTGTDGSIKLYDSNNNNTSNYSQTSSSRNLVTFTTGKDDSYLIIQKWYIGVQGITNVSQVEPQLERGSKANAYTPYGTEPIELCKIGDYQDYFYKSESKWYLHKEIGKHIFNINDNWTETDNHLQGCYTLYNAKPTKKPSNLYALFCTNLLGIKKINYGLQEKPNSIGASADRFNVYIPNATSTDDVKVFMSGSVVYYLLEKATDTEITDTTLKEQLEAIYNAPLYEQTNITQTNNDLPMILDITACKDNINGIKAFIRK